MPVFCGLCQHEITGGWEEHVASEEHQASLKDEEKVRQAKLVHLRDRYKVRGGISNGN